MPCPPRMQPIACGFAVLDRRDVQAELEAGAAPWHPHHAVAEDGARERLAVGRGGDRDARVGVEVINVCGVDKAVHGRVDRRRGAADAMAAVVEGRHHLVLAVDAWVDVRRGRAACRGEAWRGRLVPSVPRSPPEPLTHRRSIGLAGHGVNLGALGGGVASREVGVLRVGAQAVAAGDEVGGGDGDCHWRAFRSRVVAVGKGLSFAALRVRVAEVAESHSRFAIAVSWSSRWKTSASLGAP